jgi:hypothetical protein
MQNQCTARRIELFVLAPKEVREWYESLPCNSLLDWENKLAQSSQEREVHTFGGCVSIGKQTAERGDRDAYSDTCCAPENLFTYPINLWLLYVK